jgi:hypothetical protein
MPFKYFYVDLCENLPLPDFMTRARRDEMVSPDFLALTILMDLGGLLVGGEEKVVVKKMDEGEKSKSHNFFEMTLADERNGLE